jgi:hypothetical protein
MKAKRKATTLAGYDLCTTSLEGRGPVPTALRDEPLTVFLGVPPPRCTSTPPCGHCWYCDVARVQGVA